MGKIVVDIGGTKTVVAEFKNGILSIIARFPTADRYQDQIDAILESLGDRSPIDAVSIGAPGPLRPEDGIISNPPNLPQWKNVPLAKVLSERLGGIPVKLENDANLGALGEAHFGAGKEYGTVFYLTISTGIGAGIVIDGVIFGGYKTMAGEVHAIDPGLFFGKPSGYNIIERASGPGMLRHATRLIKQGMQSSLDIERLSTSDLFEAFDKEDHVATEVVQTARHALTGLIACVSTIVAPDIVVLGGGLCTNPAWFVDPLRYELPRALSIPELKDIPIRRAMLWDSAVLYGAAIL